MMRAWYGWNALNTVLVMLYCCSHTVDCFMFNPMSCSSVEVNIVQTLYVQTHAPGPSVTMIFVST